MARLTPVYADIGLAGISRDHCRLFLAGPPFRKERGNVAPVLTWLNLSSKAEVDDLYQAWRATNAILLSAPESKPPGPSRIHRRRSRRKPVPRVLRLRDA